MLFFAQKNKSYVIQKKETRMYTNFKKIIALMILAGLILSACSTAAVPPATAAPAATETLLPTQTLPAPATSEPTLEPTTLPTFTPAAPAGECSLTDHGVILALVQKDDRWVFDPANPKVLDAAGNFVDRPDYAGCNFVMQGQKDPSVEIGNLWVLRDVFTNHNYSLSYLEADSTFICSNCIGWAFPTKWNMETWDAPEGQGIVYSFVSELRDNMLKNLTSPHNWPIVVNFTDGSSNTYAPSQTAGIETGPSCKGLAEPVRIRVTGIVDQDLSTFVGSLGETGCWSLAWVDGSSDYMIWNGAYDNLEFKTIVYLLIPDTFNEEATRAFAESYTP